MDLLGKMYAYGISQGALTAAQGGKFLHGFMSGGFSGGSEYFTGKISSNFGKIAASSVVGGTASSLGGGKFANGAVTGAFVVLFNYMQHQKAGPYANLTASEKKLVKRHPGEALSVSYNMEQAFEVTEQMFPGQRAHNDAADAFRHAYFSALNAKAIGHELAYEFGVAHETFSGNPALERAMDLTNNNFGFNTAIQYPSWTKPQLANYIYNAVANGQLLMIRNGRLVPTIIP